jgi:hypothetical protein
MSIEPIEGAVTDFGMEGGFGAGFEEGLAADFVLTGLGGIFAGGIGETTIGGIPVGETTTLGISTVSVMFILSSDFTEAEETGGTKPVLAAVM